jgi:hypothetical protein
MIAAFRLTIIRSHDTDVCDLDHTSLVFTGFLPRLPDVAEGHRRHSAKSQDC